MTNKVLIDSSVLVEYSKNNKTTLLNSLLENNSLQCCITETIISEFFFQFIKFTSNKAPATVKSAKKIKKIFEADNSYFLVNLFEFLATDIRIFKLFLN